jgi:hypothetical protein
MSAFASCDYPSAVVRAGSSSIRLFEYSNSTNLGDDIQSLAVGQHLSTVDGYIDRDFPPREPSEPFTVVMQGWFTKNFSVFPYPDHIQPIWMGFHLGAHASSMLADRAVYDYLNRQPSIGCRDQPTVERLQRAGITAHLTGCMTTTFPLRKREPKDGKVFLVDTMGVPLPPHIREANPIRVTHEGARWWPHPVRRQLARALLDTYRDEARLVVTTRLHCALPCVAMGIPVIFVGDPTDDRLEPISGLAEIIPFPNRLRDSERPRARLERKLLWRNDLRHREWRGSATNFEPVKQQRIADLRRALTHAGVATASTVD